MRYHLLTLALFAAATLMWLLGTSEASGALLLAAGLTELLAWKRVLKRRNSRPSTLY